MAFINAFDQHQILLTTVEYVIMDECDKYFEECTSMSYLSFSGADQADLGLLSEYKPSIWPVLSDHPTSS